MAPFFLFFFSFSKPIARCPLNFSLLVWMFLILLYFIFFALKCTFWHSSPWKWWHNACVRFSYLFRLTLVPFNALSAHSCSSRCFGGNEIDIYCYINCYWFRSIEFLCFRHVSLDILVATCFRFTNLHQFYTTQNAICCYCCCLFFLCHQRTRDWVYARVCARAWEREREKRALFGNITPKWEIWFDIILRYI